MRSGRIPDGRLPRAQARSGFLGLIGISQTAPTEPVDHTHLNGQYGALHNPYQEKKRNSQQTKGSTANKRVRTISRPDRRLQRTRCAGRGTGSFDAWQMIVAEIRSLNHAIHSGWLKEPEIPQARAQIELRQQRRIPLEKEWAILWNQSATPARRKEVETGLLPRRAQLAGSVKELRPVVAFRSTPRRSSGMEPERIRPLRQATPGEGRPGSRRISRR